MILDDYELYIKGATDFMSYMRKHHRGVSVYDFEMDDILNKFIEQITKVNESDFDSAIQLIAKLINLCEMSPEDQRKLFRPIKAFVGDYMGSGYLFVDAYNKIIDEFSSKCSDELWNKIRMEVNKGD